MIKEIHDYMTYFMLGMSGILIFYLGIDLMILHVYSQLMYTVTVISVLLTVPVGLAKWFRHIIEKRLDFESDYEENKKEWV